MIKQETPEQAVARELREEIGVQAKTIQFLNTLWVVSGYSTQQVHIFYAEDFEKSVQHLDTSESDLVVKKYTHEEVIELIKQGGIKNSPTISAFGLYLLYKRLPLI